MANARTGKGFGKLLLLAPALIIIGLTTIYPLSNSFLLSFQSWKLSQSQTPAGFAGLANYIRAFQDPYFLNSVIVTFLFTVISVSMTIVLGLGIALILFKPNRFNTLVRATLIFPYAVSAALKGYSWRFMLMPEYGIYHVMIGTLFPFLKDTVWLAEPGWALFWLATSEVWGWAPLYALMFIGALGSISPEIWEAAKVDGAKSAQVFFRITLPMLAPVVIVATLLKTIFSLKLFDQVVTMTSGGPGRATQTLNYYVYQQGFRFLDMGYASALAYLLLIGLGIFAYFYVKVLYGRQGV